MDTFFAMVFCVAGAMAFDAYVDSKKGSSKSRLLSECIFQLVYLACGISCIICALCLVLIGM